MQPRVLYRFKQSIFKKSTRFQDKTLDTRKIRGNRGIKVGKITLKGNAQLLTDEGGTPSAEISLWPTEEGKQEKGCDMSGTICPEISAG